jgi:hypothetical protein
MQEILFQDQMPSMGGIVLRRGFVWACLGPSLIKLSTSTYYLSAWRRIDHSFTALRAMPINKPQSRMQKTCHTLHKIMHTFHSIPRKESVKGIWYFQRHIKQSWPSSPLCVFFFFVFVCQYFREFCPQNCKISRNYTRKTDFRKFPRLFFLKKKKRIFAPEKKKHFPRYNGETNANQQTVEYNWKTRSDNF